MMLVEVTWHDAHAGCSSWIEPSELDLAPYVVKTAGWLVTDPKKPGHLVIASTVAMDGHVDDVTCIPIGMVRRIAQLTLGMSLPIEPEPPFSGV